MGSCLCTVIKHECVFQNNFVHWCWEVLFMLCLHKADLYEHDGVTMKIIRQQTRQLKLVITPLVL